MLNYRVILKIKILRVDETRSIILLLRMDMIVSK